MFGVQRFFLLREFYGLVDKLKKAKISKILKVAQKENKCLQKLEKDLTYQSSLMYE